MNYFKNKYLLDKSVTFFNHGSYGACPIEIINEHQRIQKLFESQPVHFIENLLPPLLESSRKSLATFLNVNKDDIVIMDNPTTSMNEIVRCLELKSGDEILTTNHEYGAMEKIWEYTKQKIGFNINTVKLPLPLKSYNQILEIINDAITNKTKYIFISHITSPTAIIFPIKEICNIAHERGIKTIIDGAHSPGYINLNISDINPDYYFGTCHKWLSTPKGVSFMYIKKELQYTIEPLVVGWGWNEKNDKISNFINIHEWWGTKDLTHYLCIPKSIDIYSTKEYKNKILYCRSMVSKARNKINNITKQQSICPDYMLGQMASMIIPNTNTIELKKHLINDYKIEIPVFEWQNKQLLRISFQVYNTESEIDYLAHSIKKILNK